MATGPLRRGEGAGDGQDWSERNQACEEQAPRLGSQNTGSPSVTTSSSPQPVSLLVNEAKRTLQMWLNQGFWDGKISLDYLGNPRGPEQIQRRGYNDRSGGGEGGKEIIILPTLKVEEESNSQGMQVVSRRRKRQGKRCSPLSSRRNTALLTHPDLSPVSPILDFSTPAL